MYRVYTEDTLNDEAQKLASQYFDGFTLIKGIGCWRGSFEKSQIFEIDTTDGVEVINFATELKRVLGQSAVLVLNLPSTSVLV